MKYSQWPPRAHDSCVHRLPPINGVPSAFYPEAGF